MGRVQAEKVASTCYFFWKKKEVSEKGAKSLKNRAKCLEDSPPEKMIEP